ncbi:hypothetical protein P7C73_g2830, partial [Tremellales sp. Uapishka_1]
MTAPYAYCTLITRSSYLAGVIILAHTLVKHKCAYPLIVLYTDTLPSSSIRALELESSRSNIVLRPIAPLLPRDNIHVSLIAERFADTWTKLRVFQLHETDPEYTTICFLDADMTVRKSMDGIFSAATLHADDWIAASHACLCNKDHDPWAPEDWRPENCPHTPVSHPSALTHPIPITPTSPPMHHMLNSGMFVFRPSVQLWENMIEFFNTTPLLETFKFPDQDFLDEFFRNKWLPLGWQYNALKTMRYWHANIWRDDEVVCLHYIVDKPWAAQNKPDGTAGYLGRDGVTHEWWWEDYREWYDQADDEVKTIVEKHVAGDKQENSRDMRAIGSAVQAFATGDQNGEDA